MQHLFDQRVPRQKTSRLRLATRVFSRGLAKALILAAVGLTGLTAPWAVGQDVPTEDVPIEEIVVTGIRTSLADAVRAKRAADNVIDGVSAEDIGKLADTNIAEALQRVTGVQIKREGGEGSFVSVRGFDPTFTKVTVNGQSVTSARSRAGDRGLNLSVLGSTVASAIEVIKSPTADLEEGGVGGTVNIKKLRPLALGEQRLTFAAEAVHEDIRGSTNPRVSGFYNYVNEDKTLGVSLQGYYYDRDFTRVRVRGDDSFQSFTDPTTGQNVSYQRRVRPRLNQDTNESMNISGTLQWSPSEDLDMYLDVTFGETEGIDIRFDSQIRFSDNDINFADPAYEVNDAGFLVAAPVHNLDNLDFGGFTNNTEDRLQSYAVGAEWALSDTRTLKVELAQSGNNKVNDDLPGRGGNLRVSGESLNGVPITGETLAVLRFGGASESGFAIDDLAGIIGFADASIDHVGLGNFGSNRGIERTDADEYSIRSDLEFQLDGTVNTVQVGFKYTNRTEQERGMRINFTGDARAAAGAAAFAAGDDFLRRFDDYVDVVPGLGVVTGTNVRPFALDIISDPNNISSIQTDGVDDELFAERSVFALYGLAKFESELAGLPLRGNVGIRLVNTDTDTVGFGERIDANGDTPSRTEVDANGRPIGVSEVTASKSDFQALPSLNFTLGITEKFQARLALARVMRRPEIRELTPFFELGNIPVDPVSGDLDFTGTSGDVTSGESGNPNLDPFVADQLDLSFEYYPDDGSLLSLGLFYKDVKNFITQMVTSGTRTLVAPDGSEIEVAFDLNEYVNGGGAEVNGVELAYVQAFSFLPAPFDGLGTSLNYTYTDSKEDDTDFPLPGTSENTVNATLYYENDRFSVRLAYNSRDQFRLDQGDGANFRVELDQLDASMSYQLTDHAKLTFNVVNLTDKPFVLNVGAADADDYSTLSGDNFRDFELSGRQYFLGLRYDIF